MPIFDYSNRVVLITGIGAVGEGYGNGGAMAVTMAKQGAIIFGCDINLDAANKAAEHIRNDDEVKNHHSREKGMGIVDVFQQRTVRFNSNSTMTTRSDAYHLPSRT
jgi:NAD(P)-dependent dehydrogenase (short-subunit alcohol dehydrogenase family)